MQLHCPLPDLLKYCQYLDAMNMRLEGIDITDVSDAGSPSPARFHPETFNHNGPMRPSAPRSSSDFNLRRPDHSDTGHTGFTDNLLLRRQTSSGVLLRHAGSEAVSLDRSTSSSGGSGPLDAVSRSDSSPTVREVARKYPAFMQAVIGSMKAAGTGALSHPDGDAGKHGAPASASTAPPKAVGKSSSWHNSQVERLKQLEGSSCAFR